MKKTEKTFDGELVIVRAPHQVRCTVTRFYSFDEAWQAYLESGMMFAEYANKDEVIHETGFDEEYDGEELAELRGKLSKFADDEPIVEFAPDGGETEFYSAAEFTKKDALTEAAGDDMSWCDIFYAAPGDSYGEFADRIYHCTCNRHNAPTMSAIADALGVDWEE